MSLTLPKGYSDSDSCNIRLRFVSYKTSNFIWAIRRMTCDFYCVRFISYWFGGDLDNSDSLARILRGFFRWFFSLFIFAMNSFNFARRCVCMREFRPLQLN